MKEIIIICVILLCKIQTVHLSVLPPGTVKWIPSKYLMVNIHSILPPAANSTGHLEYIGRVNLFGEMIPGKTDDDAKTIWYSFNGKDYSRNNDFEVLVYNEGDLKWSKVTNGTKDTFPELALQGGCDPPTMEPLFICRVGLDQQGHLLWNLGVVKKSTKICKIPYGTEEQGFNEFDVLVKTSATVYNDPVLKKCADAKNSKNKKSSGATVIASLIALSLVIFLTCMAYFVRRKSS